MRSRVSAPVSFDHLDVEEEPESPNLPPAADSRGSTSASARAASSTRGPRARTTRPRTRAEELVEAVHRRQVLVEVAEVILAERRGRVAQHADLAQPGREDALPGDE